MDDESFSAACAVGDVNNERADEWRGDVDYPAKRSAPPLSHAEFITSFFRKSPQWQYENEYRIIRRLEKATKVAGKTDRSNHVIYIFSLPSTCIKRVILGARFNDAVRDRVLGLIRSRPELAHVEVGQAKLHQDTYELEVTRQLEDNTSNNRPRSRSSSGHSRSSARPPRVPRVKRQAPP